MEYTEHAAKTAKDDEALLLGELVDTPGSSLKWAKRLDYRSLEFSVVEGHVYNKGLPLVISNTTKGWARDRELFGFEWLRKYYGGTMLHPRDNSNFVDLEPWSLSQYLDFIEEAQQHGRRVYGKDIPCPPQWKDFIQNKLPEFCSKGKDDLMGDLDERLQADTLTIDICSDRTLIPGHLVNMGSLGHNLMVYADDSAYSLWFLVARDDRDKAIDFWKRKTNGGTIHEDNAYVAVKDLATAPFSIYVIEQREGDLMLIPSESVHQVLNKNGKSVKVSWNTIRTQTIANSYYNALPLYRSLGKPEVYRIKAIVYYSLLNRRDTVEHGKFNDDIVEEFPPLLSIMEDIIFTETTEAEKDEELQIPKFDDPMPHQRLCDFCSCDIWNRCYHCNQCGKEEGYDICLDCVAEGRGCPHKDKLTLMESISMRIIRQQFEESKEAYQKVLKILRTKRRKNLRRLIEEWKGNPPRSDVSVATIASRLVKLYATENTSESCHQCEKIQPYIQAVLVRCGSSVCDKKYCAKCLWNRYGEKIINCLKQRVWRCPYCENRCNCQPCLEKRGEIYTFSLEQLLEPVLRASYPFQSMLGSAVSDFKPTIHSHALKKRKWGSAVSPTASKSPLQPEQVAKMTERHQLRYLQEMSSADSPLPSPQPEMQNQLSTGGETTRFDTSLSNSGTTEYPRSPSPLVPMGRSKSPQSAKPSLNGVAPSSQPTNFENANKSSNHRPSMEEVIPTSVNFSSKNVQPKEELPIQLKMESFNGSHPRNTSIPGRTIHTHRGMIDHQSTLLCRNLSYNCSSHDLEVFFSQMGHVDQITVPIDKITNQSKGYAFIKYLRREDAEAAMQKLNKQMLKDRIIELEWSIDKSEQAKNMHCFKCKKDGHMARDCPELINLYEARMQQQHYGQRDSSMPHDRRRNYICFKCGREGHVIGDCPENSGPTCFKCGAPGHLASRCTRGCYICGQHDHIVAHCPNNKNASYPHKYRRTESLVKESNKEIWDEREREWDRERLRNRKISSWNYDPHYRKDSMDYRDTQSDSRVDPRVDPRIDSRFESMERINARRDPRYSSRYDSRDVEDPRLKRDPYGNGSSDSHPHPSRSFPGDVNGAKPFSSSPYQYGSRYYFAFSYQPSGSQSGPPANPNQFFGMGSNGYGNPPTNIGVPTQAQINGQQTLASLLASAQYSVQQIPAQPLPTPAKQPEIDQNDPRRREFKHQCSKVVVSRLTPYWKNGEISSKEEFKLLCKKIVNSVVDKHHSRGYVFDREVEMQLKKYVEPYLQQYTQFKMKNATKVEQWLQSQEPPPLSP